MPKKDKEEVQTKDEDLDFTSEGGDQESFDLDGWEDIKPQQNVPGGEYDFTVKIVKGTESKKTKRKGIMMVETIDNPPDDIERPRPIFNTMWLPMPGDDPEKAQIMKEMIKECLDAHGYVPSVRGKIIPNEMVGLRSRALVIVVAPTAQNQLKAPRNEVSKWLSGPGAPGVVNASVNPEMF